MMSPVQKFILGIVFLMTIVLLVIVSSKKFMDEARRNNLALEMIANVSTGLDKLEVSFDKMTTDTQLVKRRLQQLLAIHRENLLACALMNERSGKNNKSWKFIELLYERAFVNYYCKKRDPNDWQVIIHIVFINTMYIKVFLYTKNLLHYIYTQQQFYIYS